MKRLLPLTECITLSTRVLLPTCISSCQANGVPVFLAHFLQQSSLYQLYMVGFNIKLRDFTGKLHISMPMQIPVISTEGEDI